VPARFEPQETTDASLPHRPAAFAGTTAAVAQHAGQHAPPTPYAGLHKRAVKAHSDEEIADLRAGRGMGLALPAELNGYRGPVHVLELGDGIGRSAEQRARDQAPHAAMRAEARRLGERLIAQETDLDRLFAEKRITPENLQAARAAIGATQAALRAAHLRYHLATLAILTPHQAITAAQASAYDLVLMDIQMLNLDGIAATEHIRALPHPAREDLDGLTAENQSRHAAQAVRGHCDQIATVLLALMMTP
jgi:CheY-like chemotaxis protein